MPQYTDLHTSLLTLEDAHAQLESHIRPLNQSPERIQLCHALGRILAEDITATRSSPPLDNAAVDGWAFRHRDLADAADAATFTVTARTTAGGAPHKALGKREAVRIFTGAPMPEGADTVAMEEDCNHTRQGLRLPSAIQPGDNRRLAGEDIRSGQRVFAKGARLTPQDIALLAACGKQTLNVYARPAVAIFSTGDELAEPNEDTPDTRIHDANRPMLKGLLQRLPCEVHDLGIIPDQPRAVARALESATEYDAVIASGGMSKGEEDHMQRQLHDNATLLFWRLAIKPGRPVALAQFRGVPIAALPGNPVAVFVTFIFIARPMILKLAGASDIYRHPIHLPIAFSARKKSGRREFWRVRVVHDHDSRPVLERFPQQGAAILSSLTRSHGLVELTEDISDVREGEYHPFFAFEADFL
ncbi:MAG: molybdopterin molybdotransferase MoeA [Alphaproteobacteria bacterium]